MERYEIVALFFTNISQVKDQLARIGVEIDEEYLLQTSIDGIPTSWERFLVAVNGREDNPKFKIIWYDFIQEGCIQNKVVHNK